MPILGSFGAAAARAFGLFKPPAGGLAGVVTLVTTTGAGTYTVPDGITSIKVEAWGGGGGSIGGDVQTGAGAGGAYATSIISVTPGQTVYYTVGTGGTGGTTGSAGGDSWVNKSSNAAPGSSSDGCKAVGGSGANVTGPNNSTQSANSIGQTIYIGGAGGYANPENGGGGSAGPSGNGSNGVGGQGTAGGAGNNGGALGGTGGGTSQSGEDGQSTTDGGGGGGGSYNNCGGNGGAPGGAGGMGWSSCNTAAGTRGNTNSTGNGGKGGRGQVRITTQ